MSTILKLNALDILDTLSTALLYLMGLVYVILFIGVTIDWIFPSWTEYADTPTGQFVMIVLSIAIAKMFMELSNKPKKQ